MCANANAGVSPHMWHCMSPRSRHAGIAKETLLPKYGRLRNKVRELELCHRRVDVVDLADRSTEYELH